MSNPYLRRAILCLIVIALGLGLRRFGYDLGLTFAVVKYGGSVLWGMMVFCLVSLVVLKRSIFFIAATAFMIACGVEYSRLLHTPELDAFRLTLAGQLLLGRVFSLWNIVAYTAGIAFALVIDVLLARFCGQT